MLRWRWASLIFIALIVPLVSGAANRAARGEDAPIGPTSVGPTYPAEGDLLWNDGKADFAAGRFEDAAEKLQRLVDRYPAHAGYLEAHRMLGYSLIQLSKPKQAFPALRYYISGKRPLEAATPARTLLARSYLGLGKFEEAYLSALEAEKAWEKGQGRLPREVGAEAVLVKAQALLSLHRDLEASEALLSVRAILSPPKLSGNGRDDSAISLSRFDVPLKNAVLGEAKWLELKIKDQDCARLPGPGRLEEAEARDQMNRRGICLLESMLIFRDTVELADDRSSQLAAREAIKSWNDFNRACHRVPDPPTLRPRKRTRAQLKEYRLELLNRLLAGCKAKYGEAQELVTSWKDPAKSQPAALSRYEEISSALARLMGVRTRGP